MIGVEKEKKPRNSWRELAPLFRVTGAGAGNPWGGAGERTVRAVTPDTPEARAAIARYHETRIANEVAIAKLNAETEVARAAIPTITAEDYVKRTTTP